ncbi:type II secretion system F family protein [bacterium]|nr:type II secretion system F family protein [bacterium]
MAMDLLLYFGLFLAGTATFWIVYTLFNSNQDNKALSWATGDQPKKSKSPLINLSRPLVHQFTMKYAVRFKNEKMRKDIDYKIVTAGMEEEVNVDEFIGLKLFWGVLFPIIILILNFALNLGYPPIVLLLISPIGYMLPDFHARAEKNKRMKSVVIDLPFFIELLALSTQAGADFFGAIQKITVKAPESVLAMELEKVLRDIRLGSTREKALKDMAYRLDVSEATSFVNVLTDADATGASVGEVLKEHSAQMRLERFVRAEKAGARASQAMLIPLIMFILPAVFIVVFAPVALQFLYGGKG